MEDLYPLTYYSKENKKKSKDKTKNSKIKRYALKEKLKHSNSETHFIMKTVKEKRKIILKYLRKKNKINKISLTNVNTSKRIISLKKGGDFKKIMRKNKKELSNCIENDEGKNLKLFGNARYNKKSPSLFVEDFKKKIPSKKMGLIPMPTNNDSESNLYKEPKYIYTIQRNLSMTRRYQYNNKKEELLKAQKDNNQNFNNNIYFNTVQTWWKKIPQIIKIQKVVRGFLIRIKVRPIFQLYQFMKYFENFLIHLKMKKVLMDIYLYSIFKGRKKVEGIYITKEINLISKKITDNTIKIQNNYRCYRAKIKRDLLLSEKRGIINNKISFITKKIYVEQLKTHYNIIKIQNNVKNLLGQKNYVDKNLISKNNGIYYFDKIYLNYKNQKVIKFVKLMRHILQLLAFKKKIFYKKINEYNIDDINKVKFIQRQYLNHYYNNIKHVSLPKLNQKENNNIKNVSNITKGRIVIVINKFLFIQELIKRFINRRKMNMNNNLINKKNISKNYLITKENLKLNNFLEKITKFQSSYKVQFRRNKDNIINYEEPSFLDSSYDDYSLRDNKTLRQLTNKNRLPKKLLQGYYISKIRKIVDENININKNKVMHHQEGLLITKKRYYNNENKIKKIQRLMKNRKIDDKIVLQRPLTNNINFFSNNNDSYDEDFLYSKKSNNYDYQSKIIKYNIEKKVKNIQKAFLKYHNKKNKILNIQRKEKIKICFISKYFKKDENIKQVNIKFLLAISLFIKKNIQQYVFYLLKKDFKNFEYPFCLNTINRVLKYLNSNDYKGNIVKSLFDNILKSLNSNNTNKKDLLLLLNKEQEDQLREINIYEPKGNDCLDYIHGFSSFDKNLKNENFLNVRLNNTKFNNTNIYTITKFIDDEFENFVKGKYCYKCYLDLKDCKCLKEDQDDSLDIGINDDYNPKNSIKFFEYDKDKEKSIIIEGKPKTNESLEIITENKFIKKDIKMKDLINENKQKNILLSSRKNFEAMRVHQDKEKLKENIILRDDIENDDFFL